eukprot:c1836_g1_i1.p2 GENE.c1836_g1_i1~~c1836_g1_i1.p2  ORF type:complete len:177 (-),score=56.05 c1836_g1_i1:189-719(-)
MVAMDGTLKISDFGVAATMDHFRNEVCASSPGTYAFIPPELVVPEPSCAVLDLDVWAAGVTLYVLVTGVLPFNGESAMELFQNIQKAELRFPDFVTDEDLISLLRKMLDPVASNRLSIEEILEHKWLHRPHDDGTQLQQILEVARASKTQVFMNFVTELVEFGNLTDFLHENDQAA